ncbi:MAG TPA: phenylalanine 4-monooxygenase [Steroidobacteraceae bacterium]|jgi:phenylalanine-4-hydroxylase|nr:phenylalanine 4-monooxygenase [Steroidobacteraceae bacterium]
MTASDPPATFGASAHGLRGDYAGMHPDYTVSQDYAAYGPAQQDRWRRLYARQMRLVPGRACVEFLRVVDTLGYDAGIPRFDEVNERLGRVTGWQVVAVPGLLPEPVFFTHLAHRRFPVTVWLREEHEFDYIVEPDIFHDFFGHVPLLFDPVFADYMQAYGQGGQKADGLHALEYLARLYWYTVEFGLIRTDAGPRIYGAGILSSPSEIDHALASPEPRRIGFDLGRVMRTRYKIDSFQQTYFVIDDFAQLFRETAPDFAPIYRQIAAQPQLAADTLLPEDRVYS